MSQAPNDTRYGIQELAELGSVTRRTVRYYVRRGLLPAPTGTGRGKHYTQEHLDALIQIRTLQESGVSLDTIGAKLDAPGEQAAAPDDAKAPSTPMEPVTQRAWTRITLRPGVELHLEGRYGLNSEQMAQLSAAIATILDPGPGQSAGLVKHEEEEGHE